MVQYILRLDDASEYMDIQKWTKMEELLDKYKIKPIFGIIPKNRDKALTLKYKQNPNFWDLTHSWINKGWTPAMHGYEHRYVTQNGGIHPVNKRSEFAGLSYEEQSKKIKKGYRILIDHGIKPEIFFAPSHTFDNNTLLAIETETPIRIISDTVAWDVYRDGEFWFIPQQSGKVRLLPFKTITFCYHPNTMDIKTFQLLEHFIRINISKFIKFNDELLIKRRKTIVDKVIRKLYFIVHKIR